MKIKDIFIILTAAALIPALSACSKEPEKKAAPAPPAPSAGEVIRDYTKTLSTAPDKAKAAGAMEEDRSERQKNMIDEMDKDTGK